MVSELASLVLLVQKEGASAEELIAAVRTEIEKVFHLLYPEQPKNIKVFVDVYEENICVLSGKQDITPADFKKRALNIARETIIARLRPKEETYAVVSEKPTIHTGLLMRLLFLGYNGLSLFYLFILSLGFLSENFRQMLAQVIEAKGLYSLIVLVILVAAPFISIYLAVRNRSYKNSAYLAQLFFLFEIPTIILSLLLFGIFSKPVPAVWVFSPLFLSLPLLVFLKSVNIKLQGFSVQIGTFILKEVIFLSVVYIAILYSFFFPLIIASLFKGIVDILISFFQYSGGVIEFGEIIPFLIFLPFSIAGLLLLTALALLPYIVTYVAVRMYFSAKLDGDIILGTKKVNNIAIIVALFALVIGFAVSCQPSISPFLAQLQKMEKAQTFDQREVIASDLMPHEKKIKQAITDAQNARQRYFFVKDDDFLAQAYEDVFSLPPVAIESIQDTFSILAAPFVYYGPTDKDGKLSKYYEELFGQSLYGDLYKYKIAEQKNVRILSRRVEASTDYEGLLAKISIEEEYENSTFNIQEVIYEFFLPNDAIIMDLRLGPNLEYPGLISPRGSARKVYEAELRRSRDPALLEQTGPRQYRLRVFPIPSKNDRTTLQGQNQKVKFSYVVGATSRGYPLPEYFKEQNIIVDRSSVTTYLVDGKEIGRPKDKNIISIQDASGRSIDPCAFSKILAGKSNIGTYSVQLVPHSINNQVKPFFVCDRDGGLISLSNKKIAIFYDVSYTNKSDGFLSLLQKQLSQNNHFLSNNDIDLYLFNDRLSTPRALSLDNLTDALDVIFFGKSDPYKVIRSFSGSYDLAIIVTSSEKISTIATDYLTQSSFPVYIIHPKGEIPSYPSNLTSYILQSGGSVFASFSDAVNYFALYEILKKTEPELLFVGPFWSITSKSAISVSTNQTDLLTVFPPTTPTPSISEPDKFLAQSSDLLSFISAKGNIYHEISSFEGNIESNTSFLDKLHQLAKENHIITPYSSLIALVNEQQRQRLEREEEHYDRYDVQEQETNWSAPISMRMPNMGGGMDLFGLSGVSVSELKIPAPLTGGDISMAGPTMVKMAPFGSSIILLPIIAISGILALGGFAVFIVIAGKKYLSKRRGIIETNVK
ncbi:hypothetical protein FJY90_05830 [Candidatus Gottesmanbacteria bacterium]|nr:hypothetical protein [Candidatus Gottesmanbacteria bacterium]